MVHTAPVHAVIGGFHRHEIDSNTPQAARYHEERAKGRRIPIVGVSDAHGCERGELFGWYYTLVFAPSLDLDDLIEAIKSGYSVAVEALPGEAARAYGPFRLVKFALYCLREIFPQHDGLCAEEGRLMMSCAAGETDAADRLAFFTGQTADGHVRPPWDRDRDTAGKAGFLLSKGIFCLSTGLGPFCGSWSPGFHPGLFSVVPCGTLAARRPVSALPLGALIGDHTGPRGPTAVEFSR